MTRAAPAAASLCGSKGGERLHKRILPWLPGAAATGTPFVVAVLFWFYKLRLVGAATANAAGATS